MYYNLKKHKSNNPFVHNPGNLVFIFFHFIFDSTKYLSTFVYSNKNNYIYFLIFSLTLS